MNTEKITLNINAIELANIDLLVENGFAANRSELMKTAIKQYLANLESETKHLLNVQESNAKTSKKHWILGMHHLSAKTVDELIRKNSITDIVVYGILIIDNKIPLSQLRQCVRSIKVYGPIRASKEIKNYYKDNFQWTHLKQMNGPKSYQNH